MMLRKKKQKSVDLVEENSSISLLEQTSEAGRKEKKKRGSDLNEEKAKIGDDALKIEEDAEKEKKKKEQEKEKMGEAEQAVSKRSQKKKRILNIIFFFVNLGVVAGILTFQLMKEPFVPLEGLGLNVGMLMVLILVLVVIFLLDASLFSYLIKKDTGRWQFGLAFKATNIGRYYDSITPLAVGGQPFQIAYLKTHDVSATASLSIPMAKTLFWQISMFVLSFVAIIIAFTNPAYGTFASVMAIIGFVLTFAMMFLVIFLSISKNFGKRLVVRCLKLLQKMKIIKNYEKQYQRVTKYVEDYQNIMREYMGSFKEFIINFGLTFIRLALIYCVPFFIYSCFYTDGGATEFFTFFICGVLIDLSSSFFPLPGGTGMNELTFTSLFGSIFSGGRLFWAIIFWRLVTYYVYIVVGIIVLFYDISIGDRKFKWKKKERLLQEESLVFKQIQIQNFRNERAKRRRKELKNSD